MTDPDAAAIPDDEMGAVVLSGGSAVRLQGADKASIEVGGATLLEHALAALAEVPDVVVVGPEVPTSRPVTWTREDPPGGGPAAGLLAGLRAFPRTPRLVAVLAVDMPLVTTATMRRLMLSTGRDGALLVDERGKRQPLCAVYLGASLVAAAPRPEKQPGMSMKKLLRHLELAEVDAMVGEARDLDSWDDLGVLREQLEG